MDIIKAWNDRSLFGTTFAGSTWTNWRVIVRGIYGLSMTMRERKVYSELTGRADPPTSPAKEAYVIAGRRAGKSTVAAGIAVHATIARDYTPFLPPGAVATIFVISPDRAQSRTVFRTIAGLIDQSPLIAERVVRRTESVIELAGRVAIEVGTASSRTIRGYTIPLAILDEACFFEQGAEAADADAEIVEALTPALVTIPGSMILGISSPYARRGVMWTKYEKYWGQPDDTVQIYRAPTRLLNSSIPQSVIDDAIEKDPASASSEWLAEWRQDRDSYVSREIIAQCTSKGVLERPPQSGMKYTAFTDPAGGAGADSFCLAIAHMEKDVAVLDCTVTRRPPFNAESVVAEMGFFCKKFGISRVHGDHFSGDVIRSMFQKIGISYVVHGAPKREIFRAFLPMLTSGKVDLTDLPTLHTQLVALERSVSRGGTETISHPIGGHDDVAVAAAGALVVAAAKGSNDWLAHLMPVGVGAAAGAPILSPGFVLAEGGLGDSGFGVASTVGPGTGDWPSSLSFER